MLNITHLADEDNARFVARLIPTIDPATIIGTRAPAMRAYAKQIWRENPDDAVEFMETLPHALFDENMLHDFLICQERNFDTCLERVEAFLPYIDNWAVCDSLNPKVLGKNLVVLETRARQWIKSEHIYTCRFGIGVFMEFFLDEAFRSEFLNLVASVNRSEYYLEMMGGWYFATALVKQPAAALPWLQEDRLPFEVRRKAIQKSLESRRIPPETKLILREIRSTNKTIVSTINRTQR